MKPSYQDLEKRIRELEARFDNVGSQNSKPDNNKNNTNELQELKKTIRELEKENNELNRKNLELQGLDKEIQQSKEIYRLIHCLNGKEAVQLCKENPDIDLVLMDIKMPLMNGYEATKQIKAFRPALPVIAQTAYAMAEDEDKARNAGCDDYVSKPINPEKLLNLIDKYKKNK